MKFLTRVLAACILAGALAGLVHSQTTEDPKPSVAGTVVSEYDRFENKSTIDLRSMIVSEGDGLQLLLNVHGEYVGTPSPPPQVNLIFLAVSVFEYKYTGACVLNVIADEEHFKFQLPVIQSGLVAGLKVQSIGVRVDYRDLRKIARAKKVEMRFQGIEFPLSDAQFATFLDFLKRFGDS